MNLFRKAVSLFNSKKSQDGENGNVTANSLKSFFKSKILVVLLPFVPFFFFTVIIMILLTTFGIKLELMQLVDPNGSKGSTVGVNLNYDFEDYYNASENAPETDNTPDEDLASTIYGDKDSFNQHIKDSVSAAGFGTRQGVATAAVSLVGDYIKATGKRIRYGNQPIRQEPGVDGIDNPDFYLDCSSLSWWALYNGGFNLPSCDAKANSILNWGRSNGYLKTPGAGVGQPGDFLVSSGHIMVIVGTYDGGYYTAEEVLKGKGARIGKASYDGYAQDFYLLDMTDYYSNSDNVRTA
jgi:hypothetical protein